MPFLLARCLCRPRRIRSPLVCHCCFIPHPPTTTIAWVRARRPRPGKACEGREEAAKRTESAAWWRVAETAWPASVYVVTSWPPTPPHRAHRPPGKHQGYSASEFWPQTTATSLQSNAVAEKSMASRSRGSQRSAIRHFLPAEVTMSGNCTFDRFHITHKVKPKGAAPNSKDSGRKLS